MFFVPQALEMRDHPVPSSVLLIGNLVYKKKKKKKKRSKRQRRKGKIYPSECRVPKNSKEK